MCGNLKCSLIMGELIKHEGEIDQLVYKLYDLTPEEIKVVEEFGK